MHSPADDTAIGTEPASILDLDPADTLPVDMQEAETFLAEHPDVHFIDLLIADMNGIVRGKRIDRSALIRAF